MSLNFGIIGTGGIADNSLAPALEHASGAQLWSVMSRDLNRGQEFARRHKAKSPIPAYSDLDEMLADPNLHGVIIATPDKLHAEQTIRALKAGKHVLVEKPMATDLAAAQSMVSAAKAAQLCLAVAYHSRWHAGHRKVKQAIAQDFVGKLVHMRVLWSWKAQNGANWRASSEVGHWWSLAGVGTHCLDLIRWLMLPSCGEIARVQSLLTTGSWGGPHDETALVQFQFASGATAELTSSVLFASPTRIEIYGEKGFIICEGTLGRAGAGTIHSHKGPIEFVVCDPFQGELENFAAAIVNRTAPEVPGTEGLRNVQILTEAASRGGLPYYQN